MGKNASGGVTIVTSTIRPECIDNIFNNYARQKWKAKELIIVVNRNDINLSRYKKKAQRYRNVRIYRMQQNKFLGDCLNFAAARSKYRYVAKFDDDDYYAPNYIPEAMRQFIRSTADVVGKRSCFFFFPHRSILLYRRTSVRPYTRCRKIAGATIMFHKRVFPSVKFARVRLGTDVRFIAACLRRGFRLYTTSRYNFAAIRRRNRNSHTWKVTDNYLLTDKYAEIVRTNNFKNIVNRSSRP
ncbi:glycosyltransferase family 2 protein [Paenibacillus montanisoli]|uniref:Glycosyltransferase family 2 protein n=1 Tax=Paenibacillus montanisoli TaxID=2081970 RepID=A0A328U189_9BACL|nr:glycosyltransferase family A protein [Paenibacillus montanisoli]RAP76558.1 glycosyltransferase family 2 protein [Paenibacillus montanisoli]